ncbi:MAG: hypothetical protein EOP76_02735 [Variovorax sp.]|jgi:hypothetical protein|nr:MAG: hypothetical protein EOP76_02735 [Variovorax sp.]
MKSDREIKAASVERFGDYELPVPPALSLPVVQPLLDAYVENSRTFWQAYADFWGSMLEGRPDVRDKRR